MLLAVKVQTQCSLIIIVQPMLLYKINTVFEVSF